MVTWFQVEFHGSTLINHASKDGTLYLLKILVKCRPKEKPSWYELGTTMQFSIIWKNKWLKNRAIVENSRSERRNRPADICENAAADLKTFWGRKNKHWFWWRYTGKLCKQMLVNVLDPFLGNFSSHLREQLNRSSWIIWGTSESAIFIYNDGHRHAAHQREERTAFYVNHDLGWVARPRQSSAPGGFKSDGTFKKASEWVKVVGLFY